MAASGMPTYAYFDRAWGAVLGNMKKRFDSGPQDWTPWLDQLRKMHADAATKAVSRTGHRADAG